MDKLVVILWIVCAISVSFETIDFPTIDIFYPPINKSIFYFIQIAKCQDDTFDCDQAPPINVDPSICCRISRPFDRLNFPDCFVDVDETSTARNEILNRDDRERDDRNLSDTDDDIIRRTRVNVNERNSKSNDNNQRSDNRGSNRESDRETDRGTDRGSGSNEGDRRDNRPNEKPHWGFGNEHRHGGGWHHGGHGDHHSFGSGGRYRHKRQLDRVVVRTSVRAQVTLRSGVGNGNVK